MNPIYRIVREHIFRGQHQLPLLVLITCSWLFSTPAFSEDLSVFGKAMNMAKGIETNAEKLKPLERLAYYRSQRDTAREIVSVQTEVVADLPELKRLVVDTSLRKENFDDVPNPKTKDDYRAKFLFNAMNMKDQHGKEASDPQSRSSYITLLDLNIKRLLSTVAILQTNLDICIQKTESGESCALVETMRKKYQQLEIIQSVDQRKVDDITNRGSGGKGSDETVQLELNKNNRVGLQCEASSDGTFTGMDGTVWQACLYGQTWQNGQCVGSPKAVNWYEAMEAAKNSGFAGKTDWILPSSVFLNNSIHPQSCNHPNVRTYVREYRHGPKSLEVVDNFWTANTGATNGGGTVQITDSSYSGGYGSLHYDTMKSASHFDKSFTKPVYVVFVRNAPGSDGEKFARAQPLVQCNSACLANRKAAQQERDGASAQRGEEWRGRVSDFFRGGASSGSSSANATGKWEITSQADGGGLAHWYVKKYNMKCISGRKARELFTVHHLKSGGFQEVYGPRRNSLAEAAADGCP